MCIKFSTDVLYHRHQLKASRIKYSKPTTELGQMQKFRFFLILLFLSFIYYMESSAHDCPFVTVLYSEIVKLVARNVFAVGARLQTLLRELVSLPRFLFTWEGGCSLHILHPPASRFSMPSTPQLLVQKLVSVNLVL